MVGSRVLDSVCQRLWCKYPTAAGLNLPTRPKADKHSEKYISVQMSPGSDSSRQDAAPLLGFPSTQCHQCLAVLVTSIWFDSYLLNRGKAVFFFFSSVHGTDILSFRIEARRQFRGRKDTHLHYNVSKGCSCLERVKFSPRERMEKPMSKGMPAS